MFRGFPYFCTQMPQKCFKTDQTHPFHRLFAFTPPLGAMQIMQLKAVVNKQRANVTVKVKVKVQYTLSTP
jgi:hypothetical protein